MTNRPNYNSRNHINCLKGGKYNNKVAITSIGNYILVYTYKRILLGKLYLGSVKYILRIDINN